MGDVGILHLFHRFAYRVDQVDQGGVGQQHDSDKDKQHHGDLGSGRTKPVQQRQAKNGRDSAAAVAVDAIAEERNKLFDQIAVRNSAAKHLSGAVEQTDQQHGLPDFVSDGTDGFIERRHNGDKK